MATLRNVSSPFRTSGSDVDLELWLGHAPWKVFTAILSKLSIGAFKRSCTYRLAWGNTELFLIDASAPDEVTLALQHNLAVMRSWSADTATLYLKCKVQNGTISHSKAYKAAMAKMFGLNPVVYG